MVVGAGAAGMTAALRAVACRVEVTVIEQYNGPFAVQAGCPTRYIDPSLYDWAVDHYDTGRYPWNQTWSRPPLSWHAEFASTLAGMWATQIVVSPLLSVRTNRTFLRVSAGTAGAANWVDAEYHPPAPGTAPRVERYPADAVIVAFGAGRERCSHRGPTNASEAHGFPFWGTDPYADPSAGSRAGVGNRRVLISGAGDGGVTVHGSRWH
ncbi:hypothetical protein FRUB_07740 [Fimbriiglobus ruber]|uniref:Uncharacterized protein n=1 Tax=Fimbriiglobus ruber TaxID=1908690 RepID=A0A225DAL3_9BACT|nr:hypothetical protein FRUB_07740 [Fimbriiglobus ruber]